MTNKISQLVCTTLLVNDIQPDEDLFEAGYLDSLAIINLMVSLEEAFEVTLALETLDMDQFRSVNSIQEMIEPLTKAQLI